jgi:hypothetical protein
LCTFVHLSMNNIVSNTPSVPSYKEQFGKNLFGNLGVVQGIIVLSKILQ